MDDFKRCRKLFVNSYFKENRYASNDNENTSANDSEILS
jgi:hypothetical protein